MWGELLTVSIAGWLHQLTASPDPPPRWPVRRSRQLSHDRHLSHRLIWCVRTPGPPPGAPTLRL